MPEHTSILPLSQPQDEGCGISPPPPSPPVKHMLCRSCASNTVPKPRLTVLNECALGSRRLISETWRFQHILHKVSLHVPPPNSLVRPCSAETAACCTQFPHINVGPKLYPVGGSNPTPRSATVIFPATQVLAFIRIAGRRDEGGRGAVANLDGMIDLNPFCNRQNSRPHPGAAEFQELRI